MPSRRRNDPSLSTSRRIACRACWPSPKRVLELRPPCCATASRCVRSPVAGASSRLRQNQLMLGRFVALQVGQYRPRATCFAFLHLDLIDSNSGPGSHGDQAGEPVAGEPGPRPRTARRRRIRTLGASPARSMAFLRRGGSIGRPARLATSNTATATVKSPRALPIHRTEIRIAGSHHPAPSTWRSVDRGTDMPVLTQSAARRVPASRNIPRPDGGATQGVPRSYPSVSIPHPGCCDPATIR